MEDGYLVAVLAQQTHHLRSNEPGAPDNEHAHVSLLPFDRSRAGTSDVYCPCHHRNSLPCGIAMKEILSTITSKGQVTIPKEVRQHLGLSTNDRIAFVIEDDGTVRLSVPQFPTIASLAGIAGSLKQRLSYQEMRRIARENYLAGEYPVGHEG